MARHPGTLMRIIHNDNFNIQRNSSLEYGGTRDPSRETKLAVLDADGYMIISGLNGVTIGKMAALINAMNFDSNVQESKETDKPSAP